MQKKTYIKDVCFASYPIPNPLPLWIPLEKVLLDLSTLMNASDWDGLRVSKLKSMQIRDHANEITSLQKDGFSFSPSWRGTPSIFTLDCSVWVCLGLIAKAPLRNSAQLSASAAGSSNVLLHPVVWRQAPKIKSGIKFRPDVKTDKSNVGQENQNQ